MKRLLASLFGAATVAATPASADNAALLSALDEARFWLMEDYETRDTLREQVAQRGVLALFGSGRLVDLDAETLAEDGIVDELLEIGDHLRLRGVSINSVNVIESDGRIYIVEVNGTEYTVYSAADALEESWAFALETFVRIVNDLLPEGGEDKFYAIGGGNDGSGIFLPPTIVPFFADGGMGATDRPYFPTRIGPYYGMPED